MSYRPPQPYQPDRPDDGSDEPVPHWTPSSPGQPQFDSWEPPPSAPYNNIPSRPRQQQAQPYSSTQSQFNSSGQDPTYHRQPGAPPDRGLGYDRTQQPTAYEYDTVIATQTQSSSSSQDSRQQDYQSPQPDYRVPQQQYSAQYSQHHAQQAYPPRHSQRQQHSAQYSQEGEYSPQYPQQQNWTHYPGRGAAMESHGGSPGSSTAGGGGGSATGGGANVAIHIHRRGYGDYPSGYGDGSEAQQQ
ncbi:hypothetical protein BC827DRAFT_186790 [Russula dissimulans]|nr:hypothetical protein BC827DRAFT_186790 [Russula dissimulans]